LCVPFPFHQPLKGGEVAKRQFELDSESAENSCERLHREAQLLVVHRVSVRHASAEAAATVAVPRDLDAKQPLRITVLLPTIRR
jgi:hypothetical protein